MKSLIGVALLVGAFLVSFLGPRTLSAQACKDEEAMVEDYRKGLTELIQTVRKEDLEQFQRAFHQKTCLSKLTLCLSVVNGLLSCLEKASQDTTAPKEEVEASKAKHEKYSGLKKTVQQDRDALKSAENLRDAKALIEKFEVSN